MDWKSIAPLVGAVAPLAGSVIGGLIPVPGGSIIGEKLGKIIAGQLGVAPTPEAVNEKLATATEETKRAAISAAVERARVEVDGFVAYERAVLEAQAKNLADVNTTIRAELDVAPERREHWFFRAWRPAFGWSFVAIWSVFGLALTYVTLRAAWLSNNPLETLKDAWPLFASYFGPGAAVLGVLIPSRSIEKKAAIENAAPMPNAKPAPMPTTILPKEPMKTPMPPVKPTLGPRPVLGRD